MLYNTIYEAQYNSTKPKSLSEDLDNIFFELDYNTSLIMSKYSTDNSYRYFSESDDSNKKNIFQRMWEGIKAFFKRIGDWFKNLFSKSEDKEKKIEKEAGSLQDAWNLIKKNQSSITDVKVKAYTYDQSKVKRCFDNFDRVSDNLKDYIDNCIKIVKNEAANNSDNFDTGTIKEKLNEFYNDESVILAYASLTGDSNMSHNEDIKDQLAKFISYKGPNKNGDDIKETSVADSDLDAIIKLVLDMKNNEDAYTKFEDAFKSVSNERDKCEDETKKLLKDDNIPESIINLTITTCKQGFNNVLKLMSALLTWHYDVESYYYGICEKCLKAIKDTDKDYSKSVTDASKHSQSAAGTARRNNDAEHNSRENNNLRQQADSEIIDVENLEKEPVPNIYPTVHTSNTEPEPAVAQSPTNTSPSSVPEEDQPSEKEKAAKVVQKQSTEISKAEEKIKDHLEEPDNPETKEENIEQSEEDEIKRPGEEGYNYKRYVAYLQSISNPTKDQPITEGLKGFCEIPKLIKEGKATGIGDPIDDYLRFMAKPYHETLDPDIIESAYKYILSNAPEYITNDYNGKAGYDSEGLRKYFNNKRGDYTKEDLDYLCKGFDFSKKSYAKLKEITLSLNRKDLSKEEIKQKNQEIRSLNKDINRDDRQRLKENRDPGKPGDYNFNPSLYIFGNTTRANMYAVAKNKKGNYIVPDPFKRACELLTYDEYKGNNYSSYIQTFLKKYAGNMRKNRKNVVDYNIIIVCIKYAHKTCPDIVPEDNGKFDTKLRKYYDNKNSWTAKVIDDIVIKNLCEYPNLNGANLLERMQRAVNYKGRISGKLESFLSGNLSDDYFIL